MRSQFSYTVVMTKRKLLSVVTPPSIYHKSREEFRNLYDVVKENSEAHAIDLVEQKPGI